MDAITDDHDDDRSRRTSSPASARGKWCHRLLRQRVRPISLKSFSPWRVATLQPGGVPSRGRRPEEQVTVEGRRRRVEALRRGGHRRPGWWAGSASPPGLRKLRHGRVEPDPVALRRRSPPKVRGRGARRRGSRAGPVGSIHSASSPLPRRTKPSAPRSAVRTTSASIAAWVPSKTAQSVRRNPEKRGPRTSRMARASWCGSSAPASASKRSTSVVTAPPRERATPRGRWGQPRVSRPRARRASEEVESAVDRDTARSGQIASDHSPWRTPWRWKARYTTSSSTAARRNGPTAPRTATGPRTATSTASLLTPGNGLRRSSWGRRDSNPHWGRFKRPASACWATPPAPFLTESGSVGRMARRWVTSAERSCRSRHVRRGFPHDMFVAGLFASGSS